MPSPNSPARRSLYCAIEVAGSPRGRAHNGVKVAYRLVTSMRLNPSAGAKAFRARAGGLIEHGSTRHGSLFLAVKNTGNTIEPIGGTLPRGRYNVTVHLTQGGHGLGKVKRKGVRLR